MRVVETQERQPGRRVTHVRPEKVRVGLAAVSGRLRVALDHHPRDAERIEYYTTFPEFVRLLGKSSVDRDAEGASGCVGRELQPAPRSFFQKVVERLGEELPRFLERAVAVRAQAGRGGTGRWRS